MLPRKLHIDEINRYHDTIEKLEGGIKAETDELKKRELAFKWYNLIKIWSEIDDMIEFTVKHTLDCFENGDDPNP